MKIFILGIIYATFGIIPIAHGEEKAVDTNTRHEIITKTLLTQALEAKIEGKESQITVLELTYPPGNSTPPHHHTGAVFVYVLEGALKSEVTGQPLKIYHQGESFFEPAGGTHLVSGNGSADKPVKFLAMLLTKKDEKQLTIMEK